MKIDNISFGTKPNIDCIGAKSVLPKYGRNFTKGIDRAYKSLAKNKADDLLYLNFGVKQGANRLGTETLELSYWRKDENSPMGITLQSKINLNPKRMELLSSRKVKNIFLKAYEKLKNSDKKTDLIVGYPIFENKEYPKNISKELRT